LPSYKILKNHPKHPNLIDSETQYAFKFKDFSGIPWNLYSSGGDDQQIYKIES
jgi:hypothetical protein